MEDTKGKFKLIIRNKLTMPCEEKRRKDKQQFAKHNIEKLNTEQDTPNQFPDVISGSLE